MVKYLFLFVIACLMLGSTAHAADDAHAGKTMALVDMSMPMWLTQAQLDGMPTWQVKVKCYSGDVIVSETELEILDGSTGYSTSTRTRGSWNPYTGKVTPKTRLTSFVHLNSGSMYADSLEQPDFTQALAESPELTFGSLELHIYSEQAERFVAEIYAGRTQGYDLDGTQPIPIARLRPATEAKLVQVFTGSFPPRSKPLYIVMPPLRNPQVLAEDATLYMPDGQGGYEKIEHAGVGTWEPQGE